MVIWTNFSSFAITCLSSLLQKFHFSIEVVLNFLQIQKGPETSYQVACFVEFFDNFFFFFLKCDMNWPNFNNTVFASLVI